MSASSYTDFITGIFGPKSTAPKAFSPMGQTSPMGSILPDMQPTSFGAQLGLPDYTTNNNFANFNGFGNSGAVGNPSVFDGLPQVSPMNPLNSNPGFFSMDKFLGTKDTQGWGMPALQIGSAGLKAFMGMKQLGLAEDILDFQKDSFSKQFENQRTLTNAQLEDRQRGRISAASGEANANTLSVDDYMKKYGV